MNKRIDFTQLDGFGLSQDGLDFMQQSYRGAIAAMAASMGNMIIVTGVELAAGSYGNGWVVINGELLPFIGGLAAPYVYVETSNGTELFGDLTNRPVYETKAARLTSLVGGFPMTGFRRYKSDAIDLNDSQVVASSKSVKSAVDYLLPLTMPVGGIIMWSGLIVDIPTGWALCDGSGGTPNLSGRFIVGYDSTNPDYDTIGEMGGAAVVTLGINEIPAHTHGAVTREPNTGGGSFAIGNAGTTGSATTGSAGGSLPHENRPPYYTLAYIIKL